MQIPRIIHQTLPSKSGLSDEIVRNIEKLKALNPGWEHRLYDNEDKQNFILEHYGQRMLNHFNRINPRYGAARADLFRYLLIYKVGGVYLDIKSGCNTALESFIQDSDTLLLSFWGAPSEERFYRYGMHPDEGIIRELQTWHIIGAPGHPIMQGVLELVLWNMRHYSVKKFGVGLYGVLRTTGPIAYTRAIMPLLHVHDFRMIEAEKCGLSYSALKFPAGLNHQSLFKEHYSRIKAPLIPTHRYRRVQKILRMLRLAS